MKRWQIWIITMLGIALAQGPLQYQHWFLPKLKKSEFLEIPFEPLRPVQEKTYSMWYGFIPKKNFSLQFVEIPNDIEYFIYPEPLQEPEFGFVLPQPEKP